MTWHDNTMTSHLRRKGTTQNAAHHDLQLQPFVSAVVVLHCDDKVRCAHRHHDVDWGGWGGGGGASRMVRRHSSYSAYVKPSANAAHYHRRCCPAVCERTHDRIARLSHGGAHSTLRNCMLTRPPPGLGLAICKQEALLLLLATVRRVDATAQPAGRWQLHFRPWRKASQGAHPTV